MVFSDVVRVEVELKTILCRIIDVARRGENSKLRRARKKGFKMLKILTRGKSQPTHVAKTCDTRDKPCDKMFWSLAFYHGQSTLIGRVLRVGNKGHSICFVA